MLVGDGARFPILAPRTYVFLPPLVLPTMLRLQEVSPVRDICFARIAFLDPRRMCARSASASMLPTPSSAWWGVCASLTTIQAIPREKKTCEWREGHSVINSPTHRHSRKASALQSTLLYFFGVLILLTIEQLY